MKPTDELLVKQKHAVFYLKDKVTTEILYGGAAGGGKSALGCLWLIEMCQKYPKSRWLMGRSELKTLKESTLNTFLEITSNFGLSDQFTINNVDNIIKWKNGSEILMKDMALYPKDPNFDRFGSLEICGAFLDECNQISHKGVMVVKSRIRYKLTEFGIMPKVLMTCNPAKNWVYSEFYKAKKEGKIKPYRKFIQALPKDNPHLEEEYITNLLQMDTASIERLLKGNWEYDDDPSALISIDAISDYFNTSVTPSGNMYMTIDVARLGEDKTVFRVWHGWVCKERHVIAKSGIPEVINKARQLMSTKGIAASHTVADEDGVGGAVVDFLKCKGFVNNSRPLPVKEGAVNVVPNFENLRSQCAIKMSEKIEAREAGELTDDPDVIKTTSEEMEQCKEVDIDKDGKKKFVKKADIKQALGRSPDDWDSIAMRYYFELKPPVKLTHAKFIG